MREIFSPRDIERATDGALDPPTVAQLRRKGLLPEGIAPAKPKVGAAFSVRDFYALVLFDALGNMIPLHEAAYTAANVADMEVNPNAVTAIDRDPADPITLVVWLDGRRKFGGRWRGPKSGLDEKPANLGPFFVAERHVVLMVNLTALFRDALAKVEAEENA